MEFSGSPRPLVRWFRYSEEIKSNSPQGSFKIIDEETRSNLVIKTSSVEDSGVFTCLLENPAGATKCSTNLSVLESEYSSSCVSVRTLKEKIISEGDTVRFDFQFAEGNRDTIQFLLNGIPINDQDPRVQVSFDKDIASVLIKDARPSDSGLYECSMLGGNVKCQVKCTVTSAKPTKKAA